MAFKKESKMVSYKLDVNILSKIDKYSASTGIPKTVIVEKALEQFFNKLLDDNTGV